MSIAGPKPLSLGTQGVARISGGPRLGVFTDWRVVLSPTTGKYTLVGEGHFHRYYIGNTTRVEADVIPITLPTRIGRPKPKPLTPFRFAGRIALHTPTQLTIAEGEVTPL